MVSDRRSSGARASESSGFVHARTPDGGVMNGTAEADVVHIDSSPTEPLVRPSIDHILEAGFDPEPEQPSPPPRLVQPVQRSSRSVRVDHRVTRIPIRKFESFDELHHASRWKRWHTRRRISIVSHRVRSWVAKSPGDLVVVHHGKAPDRRRIASMIEAIDQPVDRGAGSRGEGKNIVRADDLPDMIVSDNSSNALLTQTWQRYVREGANAVTTGVPSTDEGDAVFIVRRAAVLDDDPVERHRAWRRPSWWASLLVLIGFAINQMTKVGALTTERPNTLSEQRWIAAARTGSVNTIGGDPLPGSSLWPAIARPVLDTFGVTGLRAMSLVFTVIAVGTASAAGSRLFGRWAARSTTLVLAGVLYVTGVATSADPTPLAMAAIGVALLAIAIVENTNRRSFILLAGLASTLAVVASYSAVVFVVILTLFFTLLRGRHGLTDSNTYRLVLAAGVLAWFLPTRQASVRFISEPRWRVSWSDILLDTALLAAAVAAIALFFTSRVASPVLRRRVMALGSALLAVPFAHLLSGATISSGTDVSIALLIVTPGIGGMIAHHLARWRLGSVTEPEVRTQVDLLRVDPDTGRIRRRLVVYANRQVRFAVAAVIVSSIWYLPWAVVNVDWRNWWIAVPFLFANFCMVGTAMLSGFNNWNRAVPIPVAVARGHEPLVGVIVPTYAEPLHMVLNTVRSVFDQDWPAERLRVVVSDDAHDDTMRNAIAAFAARLPEGSLQYNRPPKKGEPERRGESKSGNLNSAIELLRECEYIETRDSDDLVGSSNFLRETVSQLMDDPGLGYMQTIKETTTSDGDPFNNNEPFFYRGTMLARNADYAIFPCGSGLVWRRAALEQIDDFPVWNLVEDLHSGVLGLRAGWRGLYVPIVGAHAQHSPEDIANVFKQRGTWALDTTRLLVFDRFRKIPWKMRLHFLEQAIFYLLSIPLLILVMIPAAGLFFDRFPLLTDPTTYALHFWGFALSVELMLLSLAAAQAPGSLWRSRLSWIGMAPVYAKAAFKAVRYGPYKKPAYKVTRKTDDYQWYVKMVWIHWTLLLGTGVAIVMAVLRDNFLTELDLGSLYWGIVAMFGLGAFLRLSWFGVDPREKLRARFAPLLRVLGHDPDDAAGDENPDDD